MAWPHNKTLNQDCGGDVFGGNGGVSDGGGGGITDGDVLVIMVLL